MYRKNENRVHWHKDLALTNNESHNFQKLRFHGLIAHADEHNPKSGYWLITRRGGALLRGEIRVAKKVLIFRNKVQGRSDETIHIGDLKSKLPEFTTYEQYAYVPFLMPPHVEGGLQEQLIPTAAFRTFKRLCDAKKQMGTARMVELKTCASLLRRHDDGRKGRRLTSFIHPNVGAA